MWPLDTVLGVVHGLVGSGVIRVPLDLDFNLYAQAIFLSDKPF